MIYLFGYLLMCWSIAQMLQVATLGIHPWINFYYALSNTVGMLPGTWDVIISAFTVIVIFTLSRTKYFGIHTIFTLLGGLLVNFFCEYKLFINPQHQIEAWSLLVVSATGAGLGGGISNSTGFGNSLRTGLVIMIKDRFQSQFIKTKLIVELTLLCFVFMMLHYLAIGTLIIYIIDTYAMGWIMPKVTHYLMKN